MSLFKDKFPGKVSYAVKANNNDEVLKTIFDGGIKDFDVASINEVKLLRNLFGNEAILHFNNPIKIPQHISSASRDFEVTSYVIDSLSEWDKIKNNVVDSSLLHICIRINLPESSGHDSVFTCSEKYGVDIDEAIGWIQEEKIECKDISLCFMVGSQTKDPGRHAAALRYIKESLSAEILQQVKYINIGGGFPAQYAGLESLNLESFFEGLEEYKGLNLTCEPGRALVSSCESLLVEVIGVRQNKTGIIINDGVNGMLQFVRDAKGGIRLPYKVFTKNRNAAREIEVKVFGPTCDSTEVLPYMMSVPDNIQEGDGIIFKHIGAYGRSWSSYFNGFGHVERLSGPVDL